MAHRHAPHLDGAAQAEEAFRTRHPGYRETERLDRLRATEYGRLDEQGIAYLDYTGAGVYARSHVARHMAWLYGAVLGNPHSENEVSLRATQVVDDARRHILAFFRADHEEYDVVFTANATGAIKLVGEAYPFDGGSRLVLTADNHNSVNGVREFASGRGASVDYVPLVTPDLLLDEDHLVNVLDQPGRSAFNLFAYPAQSNFSGVRHSLKWIAYAQERGWHVLLDAAAMVPTSPLDLSRIHPDFVPISFYKLFGYPTGVGCLIARKEALGQLVRPWYGGGTVALSSAVAFRGRGSAHQLFPGHQGFEDGTLNYLSIAAVDMGLDYLEEVGLDLVHRRVHHLTQWTLEQMASLRQGNGRPRVAVYGPQRLEERGGTVAFNLLDAAGKPLDDRAVQREASAAGLMVRAGCHCNPGAREAALGLARDEMAGYFAQAAGRDPPSAQAVAPAGQGVVRASFGIASTFADAYRLIRFLEAHGGGRSA